MKHLLYAAAGLAALAFAPIGAEAEMLPGAARSSFALPHKIRHGRAFPIACPR